MAQPVRGQPCALSAQGMWVTSESSPGRRQRPAGTESDHGNTINMDSIVPGHRSPHRQPEDLGSAETEARRCPGREPGPRPPLSSAGVGGGGRQRMSTADPSLLQVPGSHQPGYPRWREKIWARRRIRVLNWVDFLKLADMVAVV